MLYKKKDVKYNFKSPFLLAIVLSVLQITDSDYPFGIFKLLSEGSKRFGFFLGSCCDFRCYVHIKRCTGSNILSFNMFSPNFPIKRFENTKGVVRIR
jgi:hypothetical protein